MTSQPGPPHVLVGDYTLLTKIGEGGMGVVHLARRPTGERVALKVLRPHIVGDDEARRRLAREVASLKRVRSKWVAEVLDADPWAPVPYVATRYVPGLSLHDHIHTEGPITGHDLLWFAGCLAEALAAVHGVGVLHRDIKPSNVLLEGRTPILIDFGLARVADDPRLTHTGWLLGTPGYLAPEILYGDDATAASDVHSWGATVAFAGTGRSPFGGGPSMAIMDRVRRGEFDLTGLEPPLRDVVAATLDPEPERRPTLDQLLAWLGPQTTRPAPLLSAPPVAPGAASAPAAEDPFTVPLALAAQARVDQSHGDLLPENAPTWVDAGGPPPTRLYTELQPVGTSTSGIPDAHVVPMSLPDPRVPWSERLRRGLLETSAAVLLAAAGALVPWVTLVVITLLVWVLRSGSLAASAAGARRQLRGRKWYDAAQLLVHTPWHFVQSLASTTMLLLWSAGLAAAGALLCYAASTGIPLTLFLSGLVLAGSLWWGPGGSRVRGPVGRAVVPLSRTIGWWLIAMTVVLGLAVGAGLWVEAQGVSWTPFGEQPFAGLG